MVTWRVLSEMRPDLAEEGHRLLYQFGVGLAFLATVRRDGGPRVHPMCPLVTERGLFAFLLPSPKREDLHRDRRYALHSFPSDANENAFYLTGAAWPAPDAERPELEAQFLAERGWSSSSDAFGEQELFEFGIERCLHTVTNGHGDPNPTHIHWRAP
ncbi:hypothetical protein BH24ACT26_BH24ACT26_08740 [soil metagenome]